MPGSCSVRCDLRSSWDCLDGTIPRGFLGIVPMGQKWAVHVPHSVLFTQGEIPVHAEPNQVKYNMTKKNYVLVLLALVAFAMRMWRPNYDPPPADLIRDEAPWTDEGTISHPVISALETGNGCSSLAFVGGRSLHQMMLCAVFQDFGVGKALGRWLTAFCGMIGLIALGRIGSAIWPRYGAQLAYLLAGTGFFFVAFDRLILTEGVLIALLSCCALVGLGAHKQWQSLLVGCFLGVLAMGFKLHALALAPALFVFYLLRRRPMTIPFLLGLGFAISVWRAGLIPEASILRVVDVPPRVLHPTMGLADPLRVFLSIWYGGLDARYFTYQIPLAILASLEVATFLLRPRQWLLETSPQVLVALFWFLVTLMGVNVFKYGPARYYHFVSPSLVLLSIAGMRRVWEGKAFPAIAHGRRLTVALVVGTWLMMQVFPPLSLFGKWAFWIPFLGLPLPLFLFLLLAWSPKDWKTALKYCRVALVVLLTLHCTLQGILFIEGVVKSKPNLSEASKVLADILPNDAILVGRLAGTMALSGRFDSLPLLEWITFSGLVRLDAERPVWIAVLEGDEVRVEESLWPHLTLMYRFPIRFRHDSQSLSIWRLDV